jgi:NAD(P)H-dependent FMN reductase
MTVISVVVGSTREGRFSEKPAKWILQHLKKREGVDARLLDLRDFPMPFFDQPATPATPGRPPYKNEVVQRWTAAIAQSDGFIFVTPEYNYGPSAVLKNAIDWVYPEWNRKAAGFVSYGSAMGARNVQQLRETAIELQLAPIRSSVHIPVATLWASEARASRAYEIQAPKWSVLALPFLLTRTIRPLVACGLGHSPHSRPSSNRPPDFGLNPPHCLKKKGTFAALH